MSNTFYTILTDVGLQKQVAAQMGGPQIEITHFAIGDGGGSNTVPSGAQTALVNEKWRGAINSISVDKVNPNWIVIEGVVPTDAGDFTIREIGFFDAEGDMVAVGNYPETFKGTTASGVVVDIAIKAIIEVSNADVLKIEVDPSITMASRDYVNENIASLEQTVNEHLADDVSKGEVHGLRVTDGKLEYFDGQEWQSVKGGYNVYGLEWNQTLDTYQRLDDAVGMIAITQGQNDFDNVYPWSIIKRCNLDDNANVLAYFGDPTYKDDGSNGQVMVQIPKFWYKSEMVNESGQKKYRWWIADKELKDFKLHPAFVRNGVEKDFIYIGAYEGYENEGKLHSIAGVMPTSDKTIVQFRDLAQARGSKWFQQDFLTICAIELLYLVEYAHFDSQTKIGQGITDVSVYHQTGETAQNGNRSYGDPNNATVAMSYRGVENLYGNYWKWVDGININNHRAYIADYDFESDKFDGHYRQVGFTNATSNGYVKDIGWTSQDDFMFLSIDSSGSDSSYLHDHYYQNIGARAALFGGLRTSGSHAGAFCWLLSNASSYSVANVGARLLCVP